MRKEISATLYGVLIILAGVLLTVIPKASIDWIKYLLVGLLITAAVFAFLTALKRNKKDEQFSYHEMHAFSLAVYSVLMLFFGTDFPRFMYITAAYMLFYTFSEITFSIWLFNLDREIKLSVLIMRVIIGMIVGIGPVLLLTQEATTNEFKLLVNGILFILIGANVLLYRPVMNVFKLPDIPG